MTQRITDSFLQARVDTVNRLLGNETDGNPYLTPGTVVLYGAYGSTGVHFIVNESGGVSTLCELGTKREAANFLQGMIQALRIMDARVP